MIKLIALISMVIDHLGYAFFPEAEWMRWLGRFVMPIFAYAVARGFHFTASRKRYLLQLSVLAVISLIPYWLFTGSWTLNMIVPWALAVLALMAPVWVIPLLTAGLLLIPMDYSSLIILLPISIYHFWFKEKKPLLLVASVVGVLSAVGLLSVDHWQWFALASIPLI